MDNKKKCYKCQLYKDKENFSKNKRYKDGLHDICKSCRTLVNQERKEKDQQYYQDNKDKIINQSKIYYQENKEEMALYAAKYYQENKEYALEYNKKWVEENREKILIYKEKFKENNPEYHTLYAKERYKKIEHKLLYNLRARIYNALQNNTKKGRTLELLGCTIDEYKLYLESLFLEGMNWENHGEVWEIDHIQPCISFNLLEENQQKECFHHTNTRPLFKTSKIARQKGHIIEGNRNRPKFN